MYTIFLVVLILSSLIYISSKKIEGYWVITEMFTYDTNNLKSKGISHGVLHFKNFNQNDFFRNENLNYYILNNKIYFKGVINNQTYESEFNILINDDNFTLDNQNETKNKWYKKILFSRIPKSYFNTNTNDITFKKKMFKVVKEQFIDTIYFSNDSVFESKKERRKNTNPTFQNWKRVQKHGLDILFTGVNNDTPYFIISKKDSTISLKAIENKEIDIQFIEINN